MQLYQGSHLVSSNVKAIPRETYRKRINQTSNDEIDVIPDTIEEMSSKQLNYDGPSNWRPSGQELYEDQRKDGHGPMGGYDAFKGFGKLGAGLENFPMEKYGFMVPTPEQSFEFRRRLPLKPKISAEIYGSCDPALNPKMVSDNFIRHAVVEEGFVRSHQHGYKSTKKGVHGPDVSVNDATFRNADKEASLYEDPNKAANTFKYGNQGAVPNDNYGVPTFRLDGPTKVTLKSRNTVPEVNRRPKGARTGGHKIAGNNRVGFK